MFDFLVRWKLRRKLKKNGYSEGTIKRVLGMYSKSNPWRDSLVVKH